MEILILLIVLFLAIGVPVALMQKKSPKLADADALAIAEELKKAYQEIDRLRHENASLKKAHTGPPKMGRG